MNSSNPTNSPSSDITWLAPHEVEAARLRKEFARADAEAEAFRVRDEKLNTRLTEKMARKKIS